MVMAFGKLREARVRGREEGREEGHDEQRNRIIRGMRKDAEEPSAIRY